MNSIIQDIKYQYNTGSISVKLIFLNVVIGILCILFHSFTSFANSGSTGTLYQTVFHALCVSTDMTHNLYHPWVILTHAFLHESFFHLLWNMLALYWFGRIVEDLIGEKHILSLYAFTALAGMLFFFTTPFIIPAFKGTVLYAHGASAAVMGILVAATTLAPNYIIRLLLFGDVKLKYLCLVILFIDFMSLGGISNTGGHLAHLSGAAMGWFYIFLLQKGYSLQFNFKRKPKSNIIKYQRKSVQSKDQDIKNTQSSDNRMDEERLNAILEKIKRSGISELTEEEKIFLEESSKRV